MARVNFSGVKEDKCGNKEGEVSLIKLTTCRFDPAGGHDLDGGSEMGGDRCLYAPSNFLIFQISQARRSHLTYFDLHV